MQRGFTFDVNRCTGCEACRIACAIENRLDPGVDWRRVHTYNPRRFPGLPTLHHSIACNHCLEPPCLQHCPALAYSKDATTGAVTIDEGRCIGCGYCSWACPYDAPRYNRRTGLMEKCTFCSHRLAEDREPACVALCPAAALGFERHDPPEWAPWIPGFRTDPLIGPALRQAPLRSVQPPAQHGPSGPPRNTIEAMEHREAKIDVRSEWTLLVFTFVAAVLVAWVAACAVDGMRPAPERLLPAGLAAMALSSLHLGRPSRAWRAVLNLRRSWLSREVVLFPTFLALAGASAYAGGASAPAVWAAGVAGFAALFAMDRVYLVTRTPGLVTHSAQVVLTGLLYLGLFTSSWYLAPVVMTSKLVLYVARKRRLGRWGGSRNPGRSVLRVLLGLPALFAAAVVDAPALYGSMLAVVTAGELIDRAEYYVELDPPTPGTQVADDLRAALRSASDAAA